jgi:hypothetical protein
LIKDELGQDQHLEENPPALSRITSDSPASRILRDFQYCFLLMDNGRRWRPQDQYFYHQEPPQQPQQNIRYGSAAADSVHNAQGLLAVYPMASATPTNHGNVLNQVDSPLLTL